jgi:hypothetical protein
MNIEWLAVRAERRVADFMFDEIDASVAERYTRMLELTRNVSYCPLDVVARNLLTGQNETRTIEMGGNADFRPSRQHCGRREIHADLRGGRSSELALAAPCGAFAGCPAK